ncbi:DUF1697 domain-containing protein [Paenibacillus sp. P26]|nr:DUF1697 domain-containing protein [Paenibacillus sp. P26]UUZ95431.1 DUF1697 domain-containing protein [Paenibacillus sp. P25]
MTVYIALLRGINVGGKNKIKMADLKRTLESMGLSRVQTYIQSGNVLFESGETEEALKVRLEREIEKVFGIELSVILRTAEELKRIVTNCPFPAEEVAEAEALAQVEVLYVALLPEAPVPDAVERLNGYSSEADQFRTCGRDMYLLFRHSVRDSKLAAQLKVLNLPVTVRNWNTMNKLDALAQAMEA